MMKSILFGMLALGLTTAQAATTQSFETLTKKCGPACSAKGKLHLSGTVKNVCALKVEPTAEATKLNISAGENNTLVAKVTEISNFLGGYRVTLMSANEGQLVNTTQPSAKVAYQLSYDGGALVAPKSSAQEVKNTGALSAPADDVSEVRISFPAQPGALAGTYTDTVTFEIATL